MTEEIEKSLTDASVETVEMLNEWMRQTQDFAVEQAPLLAQEIVRYGIFANAIDTLIWGSITGGFAFLGCWCWRWLYRQWKEEAGFLDDTHSGAMFGGVIFTVVSLFCLSFTVPNFKYMLKAIFAPRYYILDILKGMF